MARSKEFDRGDALKNALKVFWTKGYEGASTEDLLGEMKIGRQSMYDTFGDKQALYLEALRCYHQLSHENFYGHLGEDPTPLQTLRGFMTVVARSTDEERARGCMGINATTAQGQTNPEVLELAAKTARFNHTLLARYIKDAQEAGELARSLDPQKASKFLYAALQGLTVRAQAGASVTDLLSIADFSIEALKAMR